MACILCVRIRIPAWHVTLSFGRCDNPLILSTSFAALYSAVLCCALFCSDLHCAVIYCTDLYFTVLCCLVQVFDASAGGPFPANELHPS
jgi:hypothetical protein